MLAETLRDQIAVQLGYRRDKNDEILAAMAYVQKYVLEQSSLFPRWLNTVSTFTTTTGTVSLPTAYNRLQEEWDGNGVVLVSYEGLDLRDENAQRAQLLPGFKKDIDLMRQHHPKDAPTAYAITLEDRLLTLAPEPAKSTVIKLYHTKHDTAPALGDTNLWLTYASDLLLWETANYLAPALNIDATRFQGEARAAAQRLLTQTLMHTPYAGRPLSIGMNR